MQYMMNSVCDSIKHNKDMTYNIFTLTSRGIKIYQHYKKSILLLYDKEMQGKIIRPLYINHADI